MFWDDTRVKEFCKDIDLEGADVTCNEVIKMFRVEYNLEVDRLLDKGVYERRCQTLYEHAYDKVIDRCRQWVKDDFHKEIKLSFLVTYRATSLFFYMLKYKE